MKLGCGRKKQYRCLRACIIAVAVLFVLESCCIYVEAGSRQLQTRRSRRTRGMSEDGHELGKSPSKQPSVEHRELDIVLAHYHVERVQPMLDVWLDFLAEEKVQQLKPSIFIYCQNPDSNHTALQQLLRFGGEVVHLDNDIPASLLVPRFLNMFQPRTGFLPLSLVGHVACSDDFLPPAAIQQLYSLFTATLCPPVGYTGAFEGQFIVSRERIRRHDWWTYHHLIDIVAAPEDHWIHSVHDNHYYKDRTNPLFGHALERAWSLAFNCYESWRLANCVACDTEKDMQECGGDACQCYDR